MNADELTEKVETLQNMLLARATGEEADPEVYSLLRSELVRDPRTRKRLPRFVITCRQLAHFWSFIKQKYDTYAERRDYIWREFTPLMRELEQSRATPSDRIASDVFADLDVDHVHAAWQSALDRRSTDPEGAITLARTLVESVCKLILDEMEVKHDKKADLPKLYYTVAEQLTLAPSL